jgi:hypothetical protein
MRVEAIAMTTTRGSMETLLLQSKLNKKSTLNSTAHLQPKTPYHFNAVATLPYPPWKNGWVSVNAKTRAPV